jgi:DNA ligase-1|tara:strand:- start:17 stop:898 length:882 start_codon:yes stop_codon:yes gene_type:complete
MKIQKALHLYKELEKKTPKCYNKEYAVFEKYDGWYGYIDIVDGEMTNIKSAADREIPSLVQFSKQINELADVGNVSGRLIFEILLESVPEFSILNGILNRSKGDCSAPDPYIMVHDFVPVGELKPLAGAFQNRYFELQVFVPKFNNPAVRRAPVLDYISDVDKAQQLAEYIWDAGGEGVILKELLAHYQWGKRNCTLMKIKEEVTQDLLVVGMYKGAGKYAGTLGGLVVANKAGITHRVAGMSDAERDKWWKTPEFIMGKVVEVKAMKELPNGSLREPRFKCVRYNKNKGDID